MTSFVQSLQEEAGRIVQVPGGLRAMDFGDPVGEYRALKEGAGILISDDRGLLWVTGADRLSFLQNLTTNEVGNLKPGRGQHAASVTGVGKMKGELRLMAREGGVAISTEESHRRDLAAHLEDFIVTEDVAVGIVAGYTILHLAGPESRTILADLLNDTSLPGFHELIELEGALGGEESEDEFLFCNKLLGIEGFDWVGEEEFARTAFDNFREAGATPCGFTAAETLRIEMGIPRYGIDLTDKNIPVEGGHAEEIISYDKGCYVGQEVIARIETYGSPARMLKGLRYEGDETPPAPGADIFCDAEVIGKTGSAITHPDLGPIGLALLRRGFYERQNIDVEVGEGRRKARTSHIPFTSN